METAISTACNKDCSSMPASRKFPLSSASGLSVEVLMHIAGKAYPKLAKNYFLPEAFPNQIQPQMNLFAGNYSHKTPMVRA